MIRFENSYPKLPSQFYVPVTAQRVSAPRLLALNRELAQDQLGMELGAYGELELARLFTGQDLPDSACNLALAYAGHQFGQFVPSLGDGRALLVGEWVTPKGQRFDLQLKGSGQTPFSRRGDGNSSLGPVIREYILSEAMAALGVPTTRALAACATGDWVQRERPLPGGIFTRLASSHIRIGTFEYFAARGDQESLQLLLDYTLDRHFPELLGQPDLGFAFLERVAGLQAEMVACWMALGFIHGVMNTDNMLVCGETIDYGPCAFMDQYRADQVFSSIDLGGRYSYQNQIPIALWNLYALAVALSPLRGLDPKRGMAWAEETVNGLAPLYEAKWLAKMAQKLGLRHPEPQDKALVEAWLGFLEREELDFTLSFRALLDGPQGFHESAPFQDFYSRWQQRLEPQDRQEAHQLMASVNPVFIPRNHQVERAIQGAYAGDLTVFSELNQVLLRPYQEQPRFEAYKAAPKPEERIEATFCGT